MDGRRNNTVPGMCESGSIVSSGCPTLNFDMNLSVFTLQILVVPAAIAEVGDLDFEAILCGCLILKVDPGAYQAYPDIFKAEERVLESPSDWSGLHDKLANALQV